MAHFFDCTNSETSRFRVVDHICDNLELRTKMPRSDHAAVHSSPGQSAFSLESALQEILREPISSVKERERTALDRLLGQTKNRCVLFGAGGLGRSALGALKGTGIQPLAISDNNQALWGTPVDGTPLLSPADAAERFGKDALFIVTIRNEHHSSRETFGQLKSLGCQHVSSANPVCWRLSEALLPFLLYDLPHKLYEQSDRVLLAAQIWEDDASRLDYLANIRLRALDDLSGLPEPAVEESYFPEGIFDAEPGEVVLDCGAFDGDTIRSVIARQPNFGMIEAVEADSNSFAKLETYIATLEPTLRSRIHLHRCAIGARRGTILFENSGTSGSKISDADGIETDMVPIDDLCASTPVTMIKMDIEGAEFDALVGGKQVIQRDRPILAICVYHSQEDIWRLPLLVREICPDYRMYLKSHGRDGIQTVAYAVPPERVRNSEQTLPA
jgi:FkbM family methyltransferase